MTEEQGKEDKTEDQGPPDFCSLGEGIRIMGRGTLGLYRELKAFSLFPLWAFILVPVCTFFPVLAVIYANYMARERRYERREELPEANYEAKSRISSAFFISLLWILIGYVILYLLGSQIEDAAQVYMNEVRGRRELQLGTPEQLQFSQTVMRYIMIYGFFGYIALGFIIAMTQNLMATNTVSFSAASKATVINLPVVLLYDVVFLILLFFVEREFSHLKMKAIEHIMWQEEYFDPSVLFIVIRLYLAHVFFSALLVLNMKVFRAI